MAALPHLDTGLIVARLKEAGTPFVRVGRLASGDRLTDSIKTYPAAYVVPLRDRAGTPAPVGARIVTHTIGIHIGVAAYGDATGEKADDRLRPLRAWVFSQLEDWVMAAASGVQQTPQPMRYERGDLYSADTSTVWWVDTYTLIMGY